MILPILSYVGTLAGIILISLSTACGLYYLAELVEEHVSMAARVIRYSTYTVATLHILMCFIDGLPFFRSLFSLICLGIHHQLLKDFPYFNLASPIFITSCVLSIVNHFVWFWYFSSVYHQFSVVASFFGLMVWMVPFQLFISLSANELVLPNFGIITTNIR